MKEISILIPTYKPKEYLKDCLASIDRQTLDKSHFRVYIALNGPREPYEQYILDLVQEFNFEHYYVYLEVCGVSHARNFLLEHSVEEYITFVDDDDVLSNNYLEQLISKSSSCELVVSNVFNFDMSLDTLTENYIGKSFSHLSDHESSVFKGRKFFSSPWGKLIPRRIISDTRFDTTLKVGEDSLFMAKISKRVKGIRKTDVSAIYYVYQREGSASRSKVNRVEEFKRVSYLVTVYLGMLFKGYSIPFVLSRVVASLLHLRKLYSKV